MHDSSKRHLLYSSVEEWMVAEQVPNDFLKIDDE